MGNCNRRESSSKMEWAGEDRGSFTSTHHRLMRNQVTDGVVVDGHHEIVSRSDDHHIEKLRLLGDQKIGFASSSSSSCTREVKIKISKKELEELMQIIDMQDISLEQVLARLINNGDDHRDRRCWLDHQRSWRPVLQSIPEVN